MWGKPTGICPPWYLLHFNATNGQTFWIHVAFNPVLPFWPGIVEVHGLETLLPTLPSTVQYLYEPVMNSTVLTVSPPSTEVTQPAKTPEQLQQEAERDNSLNIWGEPTGIFPPWYRIHVLSAVSQLGATSNVWVGILGSDIVESVGLENLLLRAYVGVPPEMMDVITAAAIGAVTTSIAMYLVGEIAARVTRWNPVQYALALAVYLGGGILAMYGINAIPDAYIARALLLTIGFSLLGFVLGFTALPAFLGKTVPYMIRVLQGADPALQAAKTIIGFFTSAVIAQQIAFVYLKDILVVPFMIATLVISGLAISLGLQRM